MDPACIILDSVGHLRKERNVGDDFNGSEGLYFPPESFRISPDQGIVEEVSNGWDAECEMAK